MRLRRTHHKNGPLRRLFERLQQRVEGFVGDLMRFVDDENLEAVLCRPVADALAQFTHLVDAAIGRRVDFDDVHRTAVANFNASAAGKAWLRSWAGLAIQAARQNAGDSGFAGATLAGKDVAMRNALLCDGVGERAAHVFLPHQFRETGWAIFSGDDLVHRSGVPSKQPRVKH